MFTRIDTVMGLAALALVMVFARVMAGLGVLLMTAARACREAATN